MRPLWDNKPTVTTPPPTNKNQEDSMRLITNFVTTAALLAIFNTAFAADGRKEVVLDMGKGSFTLTVSVRDDLEGPYDFAKNPSVGGNMKGIFQHQEVMFGGKLDESRHVSLKTTAQKIMPGNSNKLTAENMAIKQIESVGFNGRAVKFDCPAIPIKPANAVCYKMSGDAVFDGKPRPEKFAVVLVAVSFSNETQGYTLMGQVMEENVSRFIADPALSENSANKALGQLWNRHQVTKN
jgi:hypothetical protein